MDREIDELTSETQHAHDKDEDHVHTKLLEGDSDNLSYEFKPSPVVRRSDTLEFGSLSVCSVSQPAIRYKFMNAYSLLKRVHIFYFAFTFYFFCRAREKHQMFPITMKGNQKGFHATCSFN